MSATLEAVALWPALASRDRWVPAHGAVLIAILTSILFSGGILMALEEPSYEVLETEGDMQLRRYDSYIVAETYVDGDFDSAGNKGFRRLADYIFGNNRSRQELEMTAPVGQATSEKIAMTAPVNMYREAGKYRITFMMPSKYTLETLPEPLDSRVHLRREPPELVASIRYSGTWSQRRFVEHRSRLESWIESRGWSAAGEPIFARYDPPFKPWFMRRNEVLIPLEAVETSPR